MIEIQDLMIIEKATDYLNLMASRRNKNIIWWWTYYSAIYEKSYKCNICDDFFTSFDILSHGEFHIKSSNLKCFF